MSISSGKKTIGRATLLCLGLSIILWGIVVAISNYDKSNELKYEKKAIEIAVDFGKQKCLAQAAENCESISGATSEQTECDARPCWIVDLSKKTSRRAYATVIVRSNSRDLIPVDYQPIY